jgi:hypothetical protein
VGLEHTTPALEMAHVLDLEATAIGSDTIKSINLRLRRLTQRNQTSLIYLFLTSDHCSTNAGRLATVTLERALL